MPIFWKRCGYLYNDEAQKYSYPAAELCAGHLVSDLVSMAPPASGSEVGYSSFFGVVLCVISKLERDVSGLRGRGVFI